jgi:hypothetical protein
MPRDFRLQIFFTWISFPQVPDYTYGTDIFSNIGISNHRTSYSINYRSIGYRINASIYRIIGNRSGKKCYT